MSAPQPEIARWTAEAPLRVLVAGWSMDQLARLSILEGAAGKSPGTWLRHRERGFGKALEHFGPNLSAAWTSARDQGVYDTAVATATKALRGVQGLDAMDLVQNLTANSSTPSGPDRSRIFHSVGKKIRSHENDLAAGDVKPTDWRVINTIKSWVNNAARDEALAVRQRKTVHYDPTMQHRTEVGPGAASKLDDEKREALILLALQSPGGPGLEVRRTVDRMIDQHFAPAARPVVRAFLEKMSRPKYRSAAQMRRLVKNFDPKKWFTHALRHVRRELSDEMGLSPQQLTNVLGGNASKVFRFMRERVGTDPRVRSTIKDLAERIDLLEPGVSVLAGEDRHEDDEEEREAELTEEQTPQMPYTSLREWFEKDQYQNWDVQSTPHAQYSRGPVPLRVARAGRRRALLMRRLTGAALAHPELRPVLVPLLRGETRTRTASPRELRAAVIRTAFTAADDDLRRRLVGLVTETDAIVDREERMSRTAATDRTARYRPAFRRWVEGRKFKHPGTGVEVDFVSLPNDEQQQIFARWQFNRVRWSDKHRPDELDDESRIDEDSFDRLGRGDVLWLSWSPVPFHKVVDIDRTGHKREDPVLEMVQIDRESGSEGETRHMHRSTLRSPAMEAHRIPGISPSERRERRRRERRERAMRRLPTEPASGWPDFANFRPLRHGDDRKKIRALFKDIARGDPREVTYAAVARRVNETLGREAPRVTREVLKGLGAWADELAEAAREAGRPLRSEHKVFRAVRLKVDEGMRRADEAIEEHVRRVERLLRGRPSERGDLHDARLQMDEERRQSLREDLVRALTDAWRPGHDGVHNLLLVGRRHLGDRLTNGVAHDLLHTAWGARASRLDREGVQAVRETLSDLRESGRPGDAVRLRPAPQPDVPDVPVRRERVELREERIPAAAPGIFAPTELDAEIASGDDHAPEAGDHAEESETENEPPPRRPDGRHRDRTELRGRPKEKVSGSTKVRPPAVLIAMAAPSGMSDPLRSQMRRKMRDLTVDDAKGLFRRINTALQDPGGEYMVGLRTNGYTDEDLKKLRRELKRHLVKFVGRRYGPRMLELANRYDLEPEDADDLHDLRSGARASGEDLTDAQIFKKFLAAANPATRQRMRAVPLADFMAMYEAVAAEDDEEDVL